MAQLFSQPHHARERLLEAATVAFGELGYEAASLDEITAQAGVTKGSLYHHFESKRDLFESVYRRELGRQVGLFNRAYRMAAADSWSAFREGCRCYLETIKEAAARRIAIVDAPAILGTPKVREIEDVQVVGLIKTGIQIAMDDGHIRPRPVGPVAHLVFSALCEAATQMDRAEDLSNAHAEWTTEMERFFDGLQ